MKQGDVTTQNEAIIRPIQGRVIVGVRTMTDPAGTQAITGLGFSPSFVMCLSAEAVNGDTFSVGFGDIVQSLSRCITQSEDGNTLGENHAIMAIQTTPVGSYFGSITSAEPDGFTITWSKTGAPIGNFSLRFACWI